MHPGANLITYFVRITDIYIYIKTENWEKDILRIRQDLGLKKLVRGGNIHFVEPFYRNGIFNEISRYYNRGYFLNEFVNIKEFFKRKTSPGCLMVEQENGSDEYLDDIRDDIFNRSNQLIELLQ